MKSLKLSAMGICAKQLSHCNSLVACAAGSSCFFILDSFVQADTANNIRNEKTNLNGMQQK
jgi:hypothetical protein